MPVRTPILTPDAVAGAAERAGLAPFSIVIKRLDASGPQIEIEPERSLYPASMIKTPLSLAALTLVAERELGLESVYEVTQANMTFNDKASPLIPGYGAALRQIVELAITISDNVATNMLFDIVGRERATHIVQQRYRLTNTAFYRKLSGAEPLIADPGWDGVHRNAHTAGDAARCFELIAREHVPYAFMLRQTLARQEFNNKLSLGLASGDRFAHKTGDTDEVTHDGGILDTESGGAYTVVVYTGMQSTDEATSDVKNARFGPFMSAIRNLM